VVLRGVLGGQNEGTQVIHTDEDDEFARIEREAAMKGQPYYWEAEAIQAAIRIERQECAALCAALWLEDGTAFQCREAILARNKA
jgi:hypothetical protein